MDQLESRGFVSAYHFHHHCGRGVEPDPTLWWTRNPEKPYHIDYTFVSRPDAIEAVTVGSQADWLAYSDHPPMTVDLRLIPSRELLTEAVGNQHANTIRRDDAMDLPPRPRSTERRMPGTGTVRFDLAHGHLSDMRCGVNGMPFVQTFRPAYFTAKWADGVLVEVRVWGPRVLQDGSLGKRELDHRWYTTRAAGCINYAELPPLVASRLRSYSIENDLTVPPQH